MTGCGGCNLGLEIRAWWEWSQMQKRIRVSTVNCVALGKAERPAFLSLTIKLPDGKACCLFNTVPCLRKESPENHRPTW